MAVKEKKPVLIATLEWVEDYEVGVPSIDKAHKEMFRIANRLMMLSHDESKHKWIAQEGLKFLKTYVVRHFAEEEAYMISVRYPNREHHVHQHVLMREKVLPRMESQLHHEKYSPESIDKFLSIIQLWLSRHILAHDVAIGKQTKTWW